MWLNGYIVDMVMKGAPVKKTLGDFGVYVNPTTLNVTLTKEEQQIMLSTGGGLTGMAKRAAVQNEIDRQRKAAIAAITNANEQYWRKAMIEMTNEQFLEYARGLIRTELEQKLPTQIGNAVGATQNNLAAQIAELRNLVVESGNAARAANERALSVERYTTSSAATKHDLQTSAAYANNVVAQAEIRTNAQFDEVKGQLNAAFAQLNGIQDQINAVIAAVNELSRSMVETFTPRANVKIKQKVVKTPKGVVSAGAAKINGYWR